MEYSRSLYQVPNVQKTVYCHFARDPLLQPIQINGDTFISSVNVKGGHRYLGMKFFPTDNCEEIIKFNIKDRAGRLCKFYAWLEDNDDTPIEIKLLVLDTCLFNSLLYGVET